MTPEPPLRSEGSAGPSPGAVAAPSVPSPSPPASGEVQLPRWLRPSHQLFQWAISTPRRRNFFVKAVRAALIIGMVGLVTAVIYPELTNTAQPAPDPLTYTTTLLVAGDNSTGVTGMIDGDDMVTGNFSVTAPYGEAVLFSIIVDGPNPATWSQRMQNPVYELQGPASSAGFTYTAQYTSYYTFLWTTTGNATVHVYVDSSYLSSAPPA